MTAIIYSHPPDYLMAGLSAKVLASQGVRVVIAIDHAHPPFACEFAEIVQTAFERNGNLNGKEFILGHLALMAEMATGDYTLKVDSDTLVYDVEKLLRDRTETAVGIWVAAMAGMQGCCYALKVTDLPEMIAEAENLEARAFLMEDKEIGLLAMKVGEVHLPVWNQDPSFYWRWRAGDSVEEMRDGKAVVVFPLDESLDRPAIARTMKRFLNP